MIDKYAYSSKLKDISPAFKTLLSLATLIMTIYIDSLWFSGAVLALMSFSCIVLSGIKPAAYLKLCLIPIGFLIIGVLTIAVNFTASAAGMINLPMFGGYLSITEESMNLAAHVFMKSFSSISCLYFLYVSTPVDHIVGLMDKIKIPKILSEMMLLILRFIFILIDLMHNLVTAQNARIGNINFSARLKSSAILASSIFIKAFIKADSIYQAMESRGYDGTVAYIGTYTKISKMQIVMLIVYLFLLAACVYALR